ncbi:hypothetical protein RSUY_13260 [Ralstonia solanacearum]|nr:hypothetical protein RSUY_13260 [Ralstonia solanacearum]
MANSIKPVLRAVTSHLIRGDTGEPAWLHLLVPLR